MPSGAVGPEGKTVFLKLVRVVVFPIGPAARDRIPVICILRIHAGHVSAHVMSPQMVRRGVVARRVEGEDPIVARHDEGRDGSLKPERE